MRDPPLRSHSPRARTRDRRHSPYHRASTRAVPHGAGVRPHLRTNVDSSVSRNLRTHIHVSTVAPSNPHLNLLSPRARCSAQVARRTLARAQPCCSHLTSTCSHRVHAALRSCTPLSFLQHRVRSTRLQQQHAASQFFNHLEDCGPTSNMQRRPVGQDALSRVVAGLPPGSPLPGRNVCGSIRWGKSADRRAPQPLRRLLAQGARKRGTRVGSDNIRQRYGMCIIRKAAANPWRLWRGGR